MTNLEEAREQARKTLTPPIDIDDTIVLISARHLSALLDATEPPKPAEDERETLDGAISRLGEYVNAGSIVHLASSYRTGDGKIHFIDFDDLREVLNAAAGYRKGSRPITDEMVKAGARALNDAGWTYEGADEPGCWCEDCQAVCMPPARAILEAAEEARR